MDILYDVLSVVILVFGLSYLVQARAWAKAGMHVMERPESLMMVAWAFLPAGLALVAVHNIWVADLRVVFTALGWIVSIKMILFLLFPNFVHGFARLSEEGLRKMCMASGAVMTVLGALLVYRFVLAV